jgi:hypothetical protein
MKHRPPPGVVARIAEARRERRQRAVDRALAAPDGPKRATRACLRELLPGVDDDMVGRLAKFVAQHSPSPDVWLVITPAAGPWLCRPASVGPVIVREGDIAVVVAVAAVYRHIQAEAA